MEVVNSVTEIREQKVQTLWSCAQDGRHLGNPTCMLVYTYRILRAEIWAFCSFCRSIIFNYCASF